MFSIIQRLPEKFITRCLMNWLDRYTTKCINELNQEIIKDRWKSIELDKIVDTISTLQQDTEIAPSKE